MSFFRCSFGAVCTLLAMACGPVDADGEAIDMIVVKGEAAALRSTPANNTRLEGLLDPAELQPLPGVPLPDPGGGFALSLEQEERDCTFQERADIKCPPGKLLGSCTVFYEEWADGSIHIGAIAGNCSINAAPSSGAN